MPAAFSNDNADLCGDPPEADDLTKPDLIELADLMIDQWLLFKAALRRDG